MPIKYQKIRVKTRTSADRATFEDAIEIAREQINFILGQLEARNARPMPDLEGATSRRGRPKSLATMENELDALAQMQSWLHSMLIQARGEAVFQPPFDRLENAGIVVAPAKPNQRGRGRPAGTPTADALVFWTRFVLKQHRLAGKRISKNNAITIAQSIVDRQKGTHSTENRSNVYRALRRRI